MYPFEIRKLLYKAPVFFFSKWEAFVVGLMNDTAYLNRFIIPEDNDRIKNMPQWRLKHITPFRQFCMLWNIKKYSRIYASTICS